MLAALFSFLSAFAAASGAAANSITGRDAAKTAFRDRILPQADPDQGPAPEPLPSDPDTSAPAPQASRKAPAKTAEEADPGTPAPAQEPTDPDAQEAAKAEEEAAAAAAVAAQQPQETVAEEDLPPPSAPQSTIIPQVTPVSTSDDPDTVTADPDTAQADPDIAAADPDTTPTDPDTDAADPDTTPADPDTDAADPDAQEPVQANEPVVDGDHASAPQQAPATPYDGQGVLEIAGGRVTTLQLAEGDDVARVEITGLPEYGNATVNPDNSIALVLSGSDYSGALSLDYRVTYADGTTESLNARFEVSAPAQAAGWGTGDHYMLETDANDDLVIETGDNHRMVYVSGSEDALTAADIAALEGLSAADITRDWLVDHPEYGGSEGMALETGLGMGLWSELTAPWPREASSHWLLFEKGYTYEGLGRVLPRGANGEDELHPLHVTSWGEGDRPVLASQLKVYQEDSSNVVFTDVTFNEGITIYEGENFLFDDVLVTDELVNIQNISNVTIRNSEIMYVTKDEPTYDTWHPHTDRSGGLYAAKVDGLLLEGNLIHHNGWEDGYDGTADAGQPPSMYSQNIYLQNTTTDVTFRDNIVSQGASFGAQLRGGAYAEDNAFIDNNAAVTLLGGIYKDDGAIGNFSFFADNLVTSGAHKEASQIGALTLGIENGANGTTLLDNIVAHLADPNNAEEFEAKLWTHAALSNKIDPFYDDTLIYNWIGSRYEDYSALWDNDGANGLEAEALNQVTIQAFAAELLGQGSATIADLMDYIASLPGTALDDTITADDIISWFQAGFGIALNGDEAATDHRFVPNDLADGIRWDNRINWTTEDVPDDGDNVDLGGNWVYYGAATTEIGDLDLGAGGQLHVTSGKLAVEGTLEVGETGGLVTVDGAGQFWTDGYGDGDRLTVDVDGGRFANTGAVTGTTSVAVSDGQAILATDGASYDLTAGSELRIEGAEAKVGFDGAQNGTAVLRMEDAAVLTFDGDDTGFSTIEEFRSGHWDQDGTQVKSGVALDGLLQIDLSGYAGGTGSHTLISVDALTGAFDGIDIYGLASGLNANVVVDYEADQLRLDLVAGNGQSSYATLGEADDESDEDAALWAALTQGQGVYDDSAPILAMEEDGLLPDLLDFV